MRDENVGVVCAEYSSIGMEEHRVDGTTPSVGAYLNLTQDHLDYHQTMDAYGEAKAKLFLKHVAQNGTAVICIDDDFGRSLHNRLMLERPDLTLWSLSTRDASADVYGDLTHCRDGIEGQIALPERTVAVKTPLLGSFNIQNVTMSVALAVSLGLSDAEIVSGMTEVRIPGRLEVVECDDGVKAVVDYAHTPDALVAAINALKPLTQGRLICVFGCGGDRDPTKRSQMAAAAAGADVVIVTSDNPRTEDPHAIIRDVVEGFETDMDFRIEVDRLSAIYQALSLAQSADLVLIAGKGHETYQEVDGVRVPFSDVDAVGSWQRGGVR